MESNIILHGSTDSLPKPLSLNAGNLNMIYEDGFLRYIKDGELEVLRIINHIVRDADWNTVPMTITAEKINVEKNNFHIAYEAQCKQGGIDFRWNCEILGKEDSSITFKINGQSKTNFKRNRIGFTVLHPIESCIGKECNIIHSNGEIENGEFPVLISPTQPFFDIRSMTWKPRAEIQAMLVFEGDIFETEDQRNWIDASYKTYCTPLARPFPVQISEGEKIGQSVVFKVFSEKEKTAKRKDQLSFSLDKTKKFPFPKIGTCLNNLEATSYTLENLEKLTLDFLRVELHGNHLDEVLLQRAAEIAKRIYCKLELVLFFNDINIDGLVEKLNPFSEQIRYFIILSGNQKCTNKNLIDEVVPLLKDNFPDSQIGAGTDAFFKELNSERVPTSQIDFLSFSINPQVHAFDLSSLTETVQCQQYVVESCKEFSNGKGVHVGPVSLQSRWNPNSTSDIAKGFEVKPFKADSRQLALYTAAWTLGSFKYLAESGANALTFYETFGVRGLMAHPKSPWPSSYGIPKECVYPIYLVLKDLLKEKRKQLFSFTSSNPLEFNGIALTGDNEESTNIIIFNFTDSKKAIALPENIKANIVKSMDASNIHRLMNNPFFTGNGKSKLCKNELQLPPFGIAMLKIS